MAGVNLLALDRVDEARAEYRRGLEDALDRPEWWQQALLSGGLTDLELVAEHGSLDLLDDVREIRS